MLILNDFVIASLLCPFMLMILLVVLLFMKCILLRYMTAAALPL